MDGRTHKNRKTESPVIIYKNCVILFVAFGLGFSILPRLTSPIGRRNRRSFSETQHDNTDQWSLHIFWDLVRIQILPI